MAMDADYPPKLTKRALGRSQIVRSWGGGGNVVAIAVDLGDNHPDDDDLVASTLELGHYYAGISFTHTQYYCNC
jgi:hypothetical protein